MFNKKCFKPLIINSDMILQRQQKKSRSIVTEKNKGKNPDL